MIEPLPEEYFSQRDIVDEKGKVIRPCSLRKVHAFLFGKNDDSYNRAWIAYRAIRERGSWPYGTKLEEVRKYATISNNYHRSNPAQ